MVGFNLSDYPESLRDVNAYFKSLGIKERVLAGRGYYYWDMRKGGASDGTWDSVFVYRASSMTYQQWLQEWWSEKRKSLRAQGLWAYKNPGTNPGIACPSCHREVGGVRGRRNPYTCSGCGARIAVNPAILPMIGEGIVMGIGWGVGSKVADGLWNKAKKLKSKKRRS